MESQSGATSRAMDPFEKRLLDITSNGVLSLGLALGHELKLFDSLAEISDEKQPVTASELAEKAEMKERYVKEWLCLMVCGRIVEVDERGEKFWIQKELVSPLSGVSASPLLGMQASTHVFGKAFPLLVDIFRRDGPIGFESRNPVDNNSEIIIRKHFINEVMPLIGIHKRLDEGAAWVLNIQCGQGIFLADIASKFQSSFFVGVDSSVEPALGVSKLRDETNEGLENLSFQQIDILNMKKEWCEKFDWAIIFNYCHSQPHPDLALKEVYRVLKKDGVLSMIEVDGTGNVYRDKEENELATLFYGASLFGCLPRVTNVPDSVALGTMLGRENMQKLLDHVGFHRVKCHELSFLSGYVLYVCYK